MEKRCFVIVLDSFGIGYAPDAHLFGDAGANTLKTVYSTGKLKTPYMEKLGLFQLGGFRQELPLIGQYARMSEASNAKDTVTGHWEMMGLISLTPFPTFPNGFPDAFIKAFSEKIRRPVLCNLPYSGTEVIQAFGRESIRKKAVIVYTSADSVFQVAAHDSVVSEYELCTICKIAREMLTEDLQVGRVIARPFTGKYPNFERIAQKRHDFAVSPGRNLLNEIREHGQQVFAVGKISDIFNGCSIDVSFPNQGNPGNMNQTAAILKNRSAFKQGLCFVNLVDFDMLYGHRRDSSGYVNALNEFDAWLGKTFLPNMQQEDCLMITADHGCDPAYRGNDHTREQVPFLFYKQGIEPKDLGTKSSFCFVSQTVRNELFS